MHFQYHQKVLIYNIKFSVLNLELNFDNYEIEFMNYICVFCISNDLLSSFAKSQNSLSFNT